MMEAERDRLARLYAELGDEHLKDLADDADDLTDDGRMALAQEMRKRGFAHPPEAPVETGAMAVSDGPERSYGFGAGVPGIVPASGPAVEQALEPGGEERSGMVSLASFYDGLELSRACSALEDVDVEPAIEEIAGDAAAGLATRFEVWVDAADLEVSREALHRRLGLFPVAEEAGAESADGGALAVGEYETRAEAEEARTTLAGAGVVAALEETVGEESGFVLTVPAGDQQRAVELLQAQLEAGG